MLANKLAPTLATSCAALPPKGAVAAWGGPARRRRQHRVGIRLAADAPEQALGFEPRSGAGRALRVAAVLG
ncbi:MAG: hypothetical protein ACTS8S_10530, partial [Giesbergeria sp.]